MSTLQDASVPAAQRAKLALFNPRGRNSFITQLPAGARVLDVGCGNDSPRSFKALRPDIYYAGLDVGDCRQPVDPRSVADEYVIVEPDDFRAAITRFGPRFDAVVSAHNLEHCDDPRGVVEAMAGALVPGGVMYLAFPCAASKTFPPRAGCLNFYDDPTHKEVPDFAMVCDLLRQLGMAITYRAERYRPSAKFLLGMGLEPLSAIRRRVMPGTWAFYGFEGIIWARKPG
jgi:SAM-dependent methyltransferase